MIFTELCMLKVEECELLKKGSVEELMEFHRKDEIIVGQILVNYAEKKSTTNSSTAL